MDEAVFEVSVMRNSAKSVQEKQMLLLYLVKVVNCPAVPEF